MSFTRERPMTRSVMDRRAFVELAGVASISSVIPGFAPGVSTPAPFELEDATIAELQAGMASGMYTARSITTAYLQRIEALDRKGPGLRSVLETNPDALTQATALDAERKAKGPRGPLHGIPILVKDNVATRDRMQSTAGSLALVGVSPPRDAFLVERLRAAGAVLLGKANLSEWANFRSTHSSSGWSGRGGQCRNPYALDRTPSGSSSGSGVAVSANLCAVAIGTETDGSIVSPSTCCGIVGIKPTLGLVSRTGVIPIAHSQDTAGPMARSVADAAGAKTLADLIAFNERTKEKEMPYFGQEIFVQAQAKGPLTDQDYLRALDKNHLLARTQGIDTVMAEHQLDALIAPTGGPASLIDLVNGDPGGGGSFSSPAAVAGYPHVTVPMGHVRGLPVGLSFVGRPWTEALLIKLAFAYEQARNARALPIAAFTFWRLRTIPGSFRSCAIFLPS